MLATKRLNTRTVASTIRLFATESVSSSTTDSLPPPPFNNPPKSQPTRLYPRPRLSVPNSQKSLQSLPATFGRNQLLPVSSSTRALLESIVAQFDAPIRYAFAYGSGVFEQDGYTTKESGEKPMLDFMFAVTHPSHWHSINMHQNPSHYPLHARTFGSSYVSRIEELGPGVWFNAYVPMNGVVRAFTSPLHMEAYLIQTIKYGVTTVDNLCSDLLNWNSLYLAGRMHKPLRIIKDDARVRLTQQVNLTSAVRTALLTLPPSFPENELFERITSISYLGDPRMILPAENRNKVANIVSRQGSQFRELYYRLVVGLPGVRWRVGEGVIEQEDTAKARAAHLRKLPKNLLERLKNKYVGLPEDESTYWVQMAEDEKLSQTLMEGM